MIKTPPIFSSRERKKRGEREKRREEFCILLVSLLLLSFLSLSATNEKKGLGGPLKTQKKGEKEKNQCLLPTILSMYIIIKGNREREKTCSTSIERDCSSRESTGQSEEIRNRVCFVLFWWTWLTWSNGEFRPHGFFFDCQSRTHIRHKTVKKKVVIINCEIKRCEWTAQKTRTWRRMHLILTSFLFYLGRVGA